MSYLWSNEFKIKPASEAKVEVKGFYDKKIVIKQQIIKTTISNLNTQISKKSTNGSTTCKICLIDIEHECPSEYKKIFAHADYKRIMEEIAQKYGEAGYQFTGLEDGSLILRWEEERE